MGLESKILLLRKCRKTTCSDQRSFTTGNWNIFSAFTFRTINTLAYHKQNFIAYVFLTGTYQNAKIYYTTDARILTRRLYHEHDHEVNIQKSFFLFAVQ